MNAFNSIGFYKVQVLHTHFKTLDVNTSTVIKSRHRCCKRQVYMCRSVFYPSTVRRLQN